jgi:uncharacterized protein
MSEIINNARYRINELKKLILDLHNGVSVNETRESLHKLMGSVPYGEVVAAEEELIKEGLPQEEVLKFCDLHSDALKGSIDSSGAKKVPAGHPVDVFKRENIAIQEQLNNLKHLFASVERAADRKKLLLDIRTIFNLLMDIEKHYSRKENLIFPYLEKYEITGPPVVMWGKDNEVREFLRSAVSILSEITDASVDEMHGYIELIFNPAVKSIEEMIYKEEHILFPMCMDTLTESDWYEIYLQSDEIGYTIYSPEIEWKPEVGKKPVEGIENSKRVRLSTGSFTTDELEAVFNSLPYDLTFVDKDDNVRFFSHGAERIFDRNKAIIGRKVQFCHPPQSVHIVEKILNDFKSGSRSAAKFWINFKGMLVHIAYYAVRGKQNEYLGTLEVTQDISELKSVEGERRLLTYD